MAEMAKLNWIVFISLLIVNLSEQQETNPTVPKVVSQCYKEQGFSFVSLYCGYNKIIEIMAAYHGRHKNAKIEHCGQLREDCVVDMTNLYDWSKCEGKHSCVQMIKQMSMNNECSDQTGVQYLQVEYHCRPLPNITPQEETEKVTNRGRGRKGRRKNTTQIPRDESLTMYDICVNASITENDSIYIHSPGYPDHYMANTDCRCAAKTSQDAKISVTYHDLALVMRAQMCVDWLLLQSPGHKDSTAVTCGHLGSDKKTVLSQDNWFLMHFHTAAAKEEMFQKAMPGFKVEVKAVPRGKISMKCYSVHPDVLNSLKKGDDESTNLLLPASDLSAIAVSDAVTSGTCSLCSFNIWTAFITTNVLYYLIIIRLVQL